MLGIGTGNWWLLVLAVGLSGQPAVAADPPPLLPGHATAVDDPLEATDIQSAITHTQQDVKLAAEAKTQCLEAYKEALEELRIADDWKSKAAAFKTACEAAPRELESLKAQLDRPLVTPLDSTFKDVSLERLKQGEDQAAAERADLQSQLVELEAASRRRNDRIEEIRVLDVAAKQRLDDIDKQLSVFPSGVGNLPPLQLAARALLLAKRTKTLAERACYQEELPSYDATRELMRARQDLATRRLNQAEKVETLWQQWVVRRSREEAEATARNARWAVITARPEVLPLAQENERLADLRKSPDGPVAKLKKAQDDVAAIAIARQKLAAQSSHVKKVADLTDSIGLLLEKQRNELPDLRQHRKNIAARRGEIAQLKLGLFEFETQRSDLADLDPQVRQVLAGIKPSASDEDRRDLEQAARELLAARRDLLDALISDYDNYFNTLVLELDKSEQELIRDTEEYSAYINERIFWIRSSPALGSDELGRTWQALGWLAAPASWRGIGQLLLRDAHENALVYILAGIAAGAILILQPSFRRRLRDTGEHVALGTSDSILPTLKALFLTALLALTAPGLLWFVSWRLGGIWDTTEFAKAVATALHITALAFLTSESFRQVCRRHGLAESHFGWPEPSLRTIGSNLRWVQVAGLPATFVVAVVQEHEGSSHDSSLGRLAFIFGLACLALFVLRVMRPVYAILEAELRRDSTAWLGRTQSTWFAGAVGVPLALALLASLGYFYTALQLSCRMQATVWLVLGLLIAHALLSRSVALGRRRLALLHSRRREAAQQAWLCSEGLIAKPPVDGLDDDETSESALDAGLVDEQVRRLLATAFVLALGVGCWLIWIDVLPALRFLDEWQLWSYNEANPTAGQPLTIIWVTAGDLVKSLLILTMMFVASRNLPGLMKLSLMRRLPLDAGGRYAMTKIIRYVIILLGVCTALPTIGIGWSNVQWLAAAMTLGLGFGLQEIFANFVSGLIVLFERPVRVGDVVTICGVTGTVTRIRSRATTIVDADRKELIVPNKEFITGQVVNWTLTDPVQRMVITVGVAYGTDTALATELLLGVALAQEEVLKDPAPSATFVSFGDSAVNFELRVFLLGLDHFSAARHKLNMAIDLAFRSAGIDMPFPQQDVHIRTLPAGFTAGESKRSLPMSFGYDEKKSA